MREAEEGTPLRFYRIKNREAQYAYPPETNDQRERGGGGNAGFRSCRKIHVTAKRKLA